MPEFWSIWGDRASFLVHTTLSACGTIQLLAIHPRIEKFKILAFGVRSAQVAEQPL